MKKPFQKSAAFATGFLFTVLLLPGARGGTADDGSPISGGIPTPRFKTSVDVEEGYNDNVYDTKTGQVRSAFTQADLNVFANLGDDRTVLAIGAGGGLTYYYSRPGDKADKLANLTVSLIHKVNERLTLTLSSYTTYQVQPQYRSPGGAKSHQRPVLLHHGIAQCGLPMDRPVFHGDGLLAHRHFL